LEPDYDELKIPRFTLFSESILLVTLPPSLLSRPSHPLFEPAPVDFTSNAATMLARPPVFIGINFVLRLGRID